MSPIERSGGGGGGGTPVGTQLDYAQITANQSITHTSATPDTVITGNSVVYDGSTRVKIEFYCAVVEINMNGQTSGSIAVSVYEGASELFEVCGIALTNTGALTTLVADFPGKGEVFLTPTAATHTYSIKGYRGTPNVIGTVAAGAGGAGGFAPAFLRITKA